MGEQRGNLPAALPRPVGVGTLTGEVDIPVGTVNIPLEHQLVGELPQGPLVHHPIAHIRQCRLHQPVHHLYGVLLRLELQVAVEGHEGIAVGAALRHTQPLVVDLHRFLELLTVQEPHLAGEHHGIIAGWQGFQHQILIVGGLPVVFLTHLIEVGVVGQFVIHMGIGAIERARRGLHTFQDIHRLVVHSRIRAAQCHQRGTLVGILHTVHALCQFDAAVKVVDGGVVLEGVVLLIQAEGKTVSGTVVSGRLQLSQELCHIPVMLCHIAGKLDDFLVQTAV